MDKRWMILGALFLARTAMGFQFQSVASAAPFMIRDLGFSYAQIGTLIGLYFLPGIVIALPGGMLGHRFGDKIVCSAGLVLMVLGALLMGMSRSYEMAFAGRLLSGVGGILFNLVLTKMTTDWFAGHGIVFAMGVVLASWPFGIGAGLQLQGRIAASYGWPWVMYAAGGLCAGALLLILLVYRVPRRLESRADASGSAPISRFALPPLSETLPTAIAGAIWGSFNVALVLFFSFAPSLLVERGTPPIEAAAWTSVALWICMVPVPFGGYAVERLGRSNGAIIVFCCLAGLALGLLPWNVSAVVLCAIVGAAVGPPAGALGGVLRDVSKSAAAPVLLGAAFFIAVTPLLLAFHNSRRPRNSLSAT